MRKDLKVFHINTDGEFIVKVKDGYEIFGTAGGEKLVKITVKRKEKSNE